MVPSVTWLEGAYALLRSRHWSRDRLEAYRDRQLRRVVRHAWEKIPYYRKVMTEAGVTPADIQSVGDLPRLPPLTKEALRTVPAEAFVAAGVRPERLIEHRTNGSTGEPTAIRRNWWEERLLAAVRRRANYDLGAGRGQRLAQVMFRAHLHRNDRQLVLAPLRRLGSLRVRSIYCLQEPGVIAAQLAEYAPQVIHGFPTILASAAQHVLDDPSIDVRPELVILGGEVVSPRTRAIIEEGFGARTREVYGCSEVNLMAWERPDGALRVADDSVILEVERAGRPALPGETGEVFVTSLIVRSMPILRLQLGDLATLGARDDPEWPFSSLQAIRGRVVETFRLPGGRMLHPWHITVPIMLKDDWVGRYQLTQDRVDRVRLSVIPERAPSEAELVRQAARIQEQLGPGVEFRLELVDSLPVEANGKFQMTRTRVEPT